MKTHPKHTPTQDMCCFFTQSWHICWCICEPMYRGPSRGPCIGSIYPTLLGFGGIQVIILSINIDFDLMRFTILFYSCRCFSLEHMILSSRLFFYKIAELLLYIACQSSCFAHQKILVEAIPCQILCLPGWKICGFIQNCIYFIKDCFLLMLV